MTDFLVTGAGGALGSILMRELVRAGHSVSGAHPGLPDDESGYGDDSSRG